MLRLLESSTTWGAAPITSAAWAGPPRPGPAPSRGESHGHEADEGPAAGLRPPGRGPGAHRRGGPARRPGHARPGRPGSDRRPAVPGVLRLRPGRDRRPGAGAAGTGAGTA